jgi:nucleotide-binding universal stress UspA family protein
MVRTVVAGLDGSPESRAAAEWAAREARLRGLSLTLVNVWEPVPDPLSQAPLLATGSRQHWSERLPREAAERLRGRHPGLEVIVEQAAGRPGAVLVDVAEDAELLVLGSRGLGAVGGFLVGSVGQFVVAYAEQPVVLVRDGEQERAADRPVVLGLDVHHPHDAPIAHAFEAAQRHHTALRVVHAWDLPPYFLYGLPADPELDAELGRRDLAALTEALRPWKQKFPDVEVTAESRPGKAATHLVDASHEASLVVVGRRVRRSRFGAHIGPVTHAVLHHSTAPVAVVAHD